MSLVEAYAGEIRLVANTFAPRGWALCAGQLLPRAEYPVLFALIGTTYRSRHRPRCRPSPPGG